jgi:hypothetical protein
MKMHELLQTDPEKLTPADAAAAFNSLVQAAITDDGLEFNQAWSMTKRLNPKLFTKMIEPQSADAGVQTTAPPADDAALANTRQIRRQYITEFTKKVDEFMQMPANAGCDVIAAFRECRRLYPALANSAGFTGDYPSAAVTAPPKNPFLLRYLHLPLDTTQTEFEAGVRGNGGTVGLNPRPMFSALVELARKQRGESETDATAFCRKRFSELYALAKTEADRVSTMK